MAKLAIIYQPPAALKPRKSNPRTHSKAQLKQIADSIRTFGFINPVLVDEENRLIAGHGRLEAAQQIGMETIPTVCLAGMTEAQIRAYVIADNRLAENAGWDSELLAIELQYLADLDLDFDVTITGFSMPEIDVLIGGLDASAQKPDPADAVPEIAGPAVTRLGDIWQIGPHRLICGDATAPETYVRLLEGETAQMVFTDPPYNVPIDGHVSGLGKVKHREFACASGEMSSAEFTAFLRSVFSNLAAASSDGAIHYVAMDWRHMREVLDAADGVYSALKNLCVWSKTNGGMGSLYRSQHELFFVFKSGTAAHINNVELGKNGRYRTNVWTYAGVNSFGATRDDELAMHPTVKPVALVVDAILDCSRRRGIVLDAFAGSGTTLVAAHKTGRRGYGIELDPLYCDVILQRLAKVAKIDAILVETGQTFQAVAEERSPAVEVDTLATGKLDAASQEAAE
jgi:DNA modification methylase